MGLSIEDHFGGGMDVGNILNTAYQLPESAGRTITASTIGAGSQRVLQLPQKTAFRRKGSPHFLIYSKAASTDDLTVANYGSLIQISTVQSIGPGTVIEVFLDHNNNWSSGVRRSAFVSTVL